MDARPRSAEPQQVGRYTLYSELASGGMGSVHFGRLRGEGGFVRTVVIKRMHRAMLGDSELAAMFVDEARTAARVRHANVVATLDVVTSDPEIFVVMEYVDGESLAGLLHRMGGARIPAHIGASIVAGMLRGLHAAHEATDEHGESLELVHRDVSPANVLVGVDGTARILDFGIAKATGRLHVTREGMIKGKLSYMPPEQLHGEPLDRRTDVYAAGVVLWEVLTGRSLFSHGMGSETIEHITTTRIVAPGDVHPDLRPFDAVVLRALERDPDRRFDTAQEMVIMLEASVKCAAASEVGAWVESTAGAVLSDRARTLAAIEAASVTPAPAQTSAMGRRGSVAAVAAVVCAAGAFVLIGSSLAPGKGEAPQVTSAPSPESSAARASEPSAPPSTERAGAETSTPEPSAIAAASPRPRALSGSDAGDRLRRTSSQARSLECSMPYVIDAEGRKHYKPECLR